ncbi:MAG: tetratricopeptide repeat protein, partial [Ardenticatenales bacterium]|nr:tetratricopeptide repeat protein [Ardenticatenales bacterium]
TTLPYFTLLPLTELSPPEAAQLLVSRLAHLNPQESRQPPPTLLEHLAERAQGNPFYLEELLNYLHDQGLDPYDMQGLESLELPTSLHSLILSRIDRLTEAQKVTLKVASIIGRLFRLTWLLGYYPALGEMSTVRRDLDALSRLDLTPLEQLEPEPIYLFKHIITREVAYESLPYATRAPLHEQLAAFLEAQGSAAVEGYVDLLAYHYAHSENRAKSREYLRQAGEAAQANYANSAAQVYYERLLSLLEEIRTQVEIHLRLGAVLELVGEWAAAEHHYQSALALATSASDAEAQAQSVQALGKLYGQRGQYEEAQARLLQALAQWEPLAEEARGVSQTLAELGVVAWHLGNYETARDYLEQSCTRCQAQGDQPGVAYALFHLASVEIGQGNYASAQTHAEESLALRQGIGDKQGIAASLNLLGGLAWNQADKKRAQTRWEESLALRRAIGDKAGIASSLHNLGLVAMFQGEYSVARTRGEESLELRREMGDKAGRAHALHNLGLVALFEGQYEAAQARFEQTLVLRQEMGEKRGIVDSLNGLGDVATLLGQYEVAQARFEESLALRREIGDKAGIATSLSNLGLVAYRRGDSESAGLYYRESLAMAQAFGENALVATILVGLTALMMNEGAPGSAHLALRLLATVETQCTAMGQKLYPLSQTLFDEMLAASRASFSETVFASTWAEGQAMTLDEAVAHVIHS